MEPSGPVDRNGRFHLRGRRRRELRLPGHGVRDFADRWSRSAESRAAAPPAMCRSRSEARSDRAGPLHAVAPDSSGDGTSPATRARPRRSADRAGNAERRHGRGGAGAGSRLRALGGRLQHVRHSTTSVGISSTGPDGTRCQEQGKDHEQHLRGLPQGTSRCPTECSSPRSPATTTTTADRHRPRHVTRDPVPDRDRRRRLAGRAGAPAPGASSATRARCAGTSAAGSCGAAQRHRDERPRHLLARSGWAAATTRRTLEHGGLREPRLRLLGRLHPRRRLPLQLGAEEARLLARRRPAAANPMAVHRAS